MDFQKVNQHAFDFHLNPHRRQIVRTLAHKAFGPGTQNLDANTLQTMTINQSEFTDRLNKVDVYLPVEETTHTMEYVDEEMSASCTLGPEVAAIIERTNSYRQMAERVVGKEGGAKGVRAIQHALREDIKRPHVATATHAVFAGMMVFIVYWIFHAASKYNEWTANMVEENEIIHLLKLILAPFSIIVHVIAFLSASIGLAALTNTFSKRVADTSGLVMTHVFLMIAAALFIAVQYLHSHVQRQHLMILLIGCMLLVLLNFIHYYIGSVVALRSVSRSTFDKCAFYAHGQRHLFDRSSSSEFSVLVLIGFVATIYLLSSFTYLYLKSK